MKVAFITNICPHYRVKTFELLSKYINTEYYFFSAGDEWYWQSKHGTSQGKFHFEYLPGFKIGNNRIVPTLPIKLIKGDYDVIIKCITGRFALPITYLVARLLKKPFILWTGIWTRLQTPFHRLFFPLTLYFYRHSDAIVVYGEHVKQYLVSEGVPAERIFVCTHAVDNEFYSQNVSEDQKTYLLNELGITENEKVVLYLGRLEETKGIRYLIEAFSLLKHKKVKLIIAGEGSVKPDLEKLVENYGISEQVIFTGYVPIEKTLPFYAISYVYVLPSVSVKEGKEPWGLVVNEAFNQAVPVIATDAVGAAAGGLVVDEKNGFVVPERDANELAKAIESLLENESLRSQMSQKAQETIRNWDNEHMVLAFRNAVEFVMKNKTGK